METLSPPALQRLLVFAAFTATIGTILLNSTHGFLVEGLAAAVAFGAIDTFKVLIVAVRCRALAYVPLAVACVCLTAISTLALTDFFAERLGANAADKAANAERIAAVKAQRAVIEEELSSLGKERLIVGWSIRSSRQVGAEISGKKREVAWSATEGCVVNVTGQRRQFCAEVDRLAGDLEAAKRSENLATREADVRRRLGELDAPASIEARDRVNRLFVNLLDLRNHPTHALALTLALIVEALTIFFPVVVANADRASASAASSASDVRATPNMHPRAGRKTTEMTASGRVKTDGVVVQLRSRQPVARRGSSTSWETPSVREGSAATARDGNASSATALPIATLPRGNPQQTRALAVDGNPLRNPLRSRREAEDDLLMLLQGGNPVFSQSWLAKRWGVNPGQASKWVAAMERDGVIVVGIAEDGSKSFKLPT